MTTPTPFLAALRRALRGGLFYHAVPLTPRSLPRLFTTTAPLPIKQMPPRPKPPPEDEIEEAFLKGSGPGGQKINKTNSAVQLIHIPTGIVIKCQATRSREQNRKTARELLAARLDELRNGDQSRTAIVGNVKKKRSDSAAKKARRKYRMLEEKKKAAGEAKEDPDKPDLPGSA